MQANVGSTDRIVRIVLGIILVALFFYLAPPWKYVALVVGLVAIATALMRFCGLYRLLGINTSRPG
ncbi:YgaP family membrane protein [Luteimonas sp. e5]